MLLGIKLNKSLFDWPLTQAHAQPSTAFSILATGSRVFQDALCSRRNLGQACFFPKAKVFKHEGLADFDSVSSERLQQGASIVFFSSLTSPAQNSRCRTWLPRPFLCFSSFLYFDFPVLLCRRSQDLRPFGAANPEKLQISQFKDWLQCMERWNQPKVSRGCKGSTSMPKYVSGGCVSIVPAFIFDNIFWLLKSRRIVIENNARKHDRGDSPCFDVLM